MNTNRTARVLILFIALILAAAAFSSFTSATTINTLETSTGTHSKINVTMNPGGGTNSAVFFTLPAEVKAVKDISLSLTTYPASGNHPRDLSIDVGTDGLVDYEFIGPGYGEMNHLTVFQENRTLQTSVVDGAAQYDGRLLLPRDVQITSASLDILPRDVFDTAAVVSVADQTDSAPSVAVFDFDGDGDQDLASVTGTGDSVRWYENDDVTTPGTGDGTSWTGYNVATALNETSDLSVGDFDGDSLTDIIVVAESTTYDNDVDVVWFKCPSDPATQTWTSYVIESAMTEVDMLRVADLDNDDDLDLVVRSGKTNFYAYYNDDTPTDGGWDKELLFFDDGNVGNFEITDLDGDDDVDIVVLEGSITSSVTAYLNPASNSNQTMWNVYGIDHLPGDLAAMDHLDVDLDGDTDLVVATNNPAKVYWLEAPDEITGTWNRHTLYTPGSGTIAWLRAEDISSDGLSDVLVASPDLGEITLLYQPNDPVEDPWFEDTVYSGASTPSFISMADLDGSGTEEPIWSSRSDGHIRWMDLSFTYLSDIQVDIGSDGSVDYTKTGVFDSGETGSDVSGGLATHLAGPLDVNYTFTDIWGNDMVEVPFKVSGTGTGGLVFGSLDVKYGFTAFVLGRNDRPLKEQMSNLVDGTEKRIYVTVTTTSEGDVELSGFELEYDGPPEMIGTLPDSVSVLEEQKDEHLLDLSVYFSDDYLNADQLVYDIESNPQDELVYIRVNDGHWLTVDATGALDYNGTFDIMLNVQDGIGNIVVYGPLTVVVENVNDEPAVLDAIPDIQVPEDSQNTLMDLNQYFEDVDDTELFFDAYLTTDNDNVQVYVGSDDKLHIDTLNDYFATGLEMVIVADDDADRSDAATLQTVLLDVIAVNDAPFWKTASLQVTLEEDSTYLKKLDLVGYVDDLDDDIFALAFSKDSSPDLVRVDLVESENHVWLDVTPNADYHGTTSLNVIVSDTSGRSSKVPVNIVVKPVNDVPIVGITSVATGDVISGNVILSGFASDKEDDVTVELKIDGQGYTSGWLEISSEESWGHMWQTEENADGMYIIAVRAYDGTVYSVTQTVGLIVRNNPLNPIVDTDQDGIPDNLDAFPNNPSEWEDIDGDSHGDNQEDVFPNDRTEWWDSDLDGIGDNSDPDPYHYTKIPDSASDPGPFGQDDTVFGLAIPWVIGLLTTAAGIAILIFGTEVGFVSFSYTLVFLYSKLSKKKVEDHEVRGLIRGYILANPGDHYSNIKKKLNLNNGTLAYHLKILEEREYIRSRRDGIYKRYYPERMKIDPSMAPLSTQEQILNMIIEHPAVSRRELAKALGISRQVVNYHTKVLVNGGLVTYRRESGATIYFVVEES